MITRYTRPKRIKKPLIILLLIAIIATPPTLLYLDIISLGDGNAQQQEIIIQPKAELEQPTIEKVAASSAKNIVNKRKHPVQQEILTPLDEVMHGNK